MIIKSYLIGSYAKAAQWSSVVLMMIGLQACSKVVADETPQPSHYLQASSEQLTQQDSYQVENKFVGKVIAQQDANLGFEFAGIIKTLHVIEGQQVEKGQLLAELNTQLLLIERNQLEAQLQQGQAEFDLIQANLTRLSSLSERGFTSEQKIDELSSQKRVIAANIRSTLSALEASQYRIDKSKLLAPFAGIVSSRQIAQGEVIAAGTTAFRLLQTGTSEVIVGVPASFIKQLKGKAHQLQIAGINYNATLLSMGNEVNSVTRTISLRFSIADNSPVYNGQLAYLTLSQAYQQSGYWVPLSAITDGVRGMWNIYTLDQDVAQRDLDPQQSPALFQLKSTTVTVLHATETAAYVQGDLKNNQAYVNAGIHRFVPGQVVTLSHQQAFANKAVDTATAEHKI
ncbi:efflux RND transporter periplasmic adaptor subunit [Moritella sp. Urea-trap-13]|uniref:efflux RND transporter periplasmic adaptor subunit n=1 Tax=Moritella sp. Urea-trap-13 TaxID=2058327 RepID=UPI000C32D9AC|nr:efflux RND transporter periplasmic adaptor subunit [Moritella sp. Urea-trap-13]PKH05510.1 efflux RND transporter periplasmic adaptor subunit [Moritella sp. Urea-trap-13]